MNLRSNSALSDNRASTSYSSIYSLITKGERPIFFCKMAVQKKSNISNLLLYIKYRIFDNFHDDLIFAFLAISFKSKRIEIVSLIIFYIKLFKLQKRNMKIKNVTNFSSFLQILTREKMHDVLPFLFGVQ